MLSCIRISRRSSLQVIRSFSTSESSPKDGERKTTADFDDSNNPKWLTDALLKTPVLDLSERSTYSNYMHPTVYIYIICT